MAPFLQVLARAAQLSSGFIGKHPVGPGEQFNAQAPDSPTSTEISPGNETSEIGYGHGTSDYVFYRGSGALQEGWPDEHRWMSYDDMWQANLPGMQSSCTSAGLAEIDNSPSEISALHKAITTVSSVTSVDERFILAVILQESKACVRVRTTSSPGAAVRNPGLMQSHNGRGSCADEVECSSLMITQMIKDGTGGTPSGDGLKQCLTSATGSSAEKVFRAARIYNSGSIAPSGLLSEGVATHCYASDIANRLMGWTDAPTKCFLDGR